MKLKKLKKSKYPNLELQTVKLRSKKQKLNPKAEIKLTETLLSKIANVIYLYHVTGKTILFLGLPTNFNKVLKKTKHLFVPEFMWQTNMFDNNTTNTLKNSKKSKIPKNILKLKKRLRKKVDLVIINDKDKNHIAFKESYLARIPVIYLTESLEITDKKYSYTSTCSYNFFAEKKENTNFFFLFLKTVLLRAKKCNKKLLPNNRILQKKNRRNVKFHN